MHQAIYQPIEFLPMGIQLELRESRMREQHLLKPRQRPS